MTKQGYMIEPWFDSERKFSALGIYLIIVQLIAVGRILQLSSWSLSLPRRCHRCCGRRASRPQQWHLFVGMAEVCPVLDSADADGHIAFM